MEINREVGGRQLRLRYTVFPSSLCKKEQSQGLGT